MKKITYFLVLIFAITLFTNCEKEKIKPDDENIEHPFKEYLGVWDVDSIYHGDNRSYAEASESVWDIQEIKFIKINNDNLREYQSWYVSINNLILNYGGMLEEHTIISPPQNNKMIIFAGIFTFYLNKRI